MTITRTTDSRERLFTAAMKLIGAEGPGAVTVDRIAAEAGVAKGTVYYQFGSKNDLVRSLLDHGFVSMREAVGRHVEDADPVAALEAMTRAALDWLEGNEGYAKLWIGQLLHPNSPWAEQIVSMRRELLELIAGPLRRLAVTRPDVTPEDVAMALFGATYVLAISELGLPAVRCRRDAQVAAVMCAVHGYLG